jgi:hypothetical protein
MLVLGGYVTALPMRGCAAGQFPPTSSDPGRGEQTPMRHRLAT